MRNLGDATSSFVLLEYSGSMTEIKSGFPGVFRRDVSFPCSQVQLSARGAFVGNNMIYFVFFFSINQVRRRLGEVRTMCFSLSIRS